MVLMLCMYRLEGEVGLRLAFEKGSSKYFPASNSAKEVRDLLLAACVRQGATFRYGSSLERLVSDGHGWACHMSDQAVHRGNRVVRLFQGRRASKTSYHDQMKGDKEDFDTLYELFGILEMMHRYRFQGRRTS